MGSTGSIGRNTLRVIDALGPQYQVAALSAHKSVSLLAEQARRYKPRFASVADKTCAEQFRASCNGLDVDVLAGPEGLVRIAELDHVDTVVAAVVGAAGLPAVLAAARKGKRLAVANKEPLVIAGQLLRKEVRENGATILPVDSEHSAVFQAMQSGRREEVSRIILTASGGPFRQATADEIRDVTVEQALAHPVWNMGPKITIDSATMMNKAFEIIEAHWLFDIPVDKIEVYRRARYVHSDSVCADASRTCSRHCAEAAARGNGAIDVRVAEHRNLQGSVAGI